MDQMRLKIERFSRCLICPAYAASQRSHAGVDLVDRGVSAFRLHQRQEKLEGEAFPVPAAMLLLRQPAYYFRRVAAWQAASPLQPLSASPNTEDVPHIQNRVELAVASTADHLAKGLPSASLEPHHLHVFQWRKVVLAGVNDNAGDQNI